MSAQPRAATTICCGVLPVPTMMTLKNGAFVQFKVKKLTDKWSLTHQSFCSHKDSNFTLEMDRSHLPNFWSCLLPFMFTGYSCDHFWETNQKLQACYQFNLYTILTWSQAQATCHAQGGNLLSITSLAEHRYIRGRHLIRQHNFPSSVVVLRKIWCFKVRKNMTGDAFVSVFCGRPTSKRWSNGMDRAEPPERWTGVAMVWWGPSVIG